MLHSCICSHSRASLIELLDDEEDVDVEDYETRKEGRKEGTHFTAANVRGTN